MINTMQELRDLHDETTIRGMFVTQNFIDTHCRWDNRNDCYNPVEDFGDWESCDIDENFQIISVYEN